MAPVAFVGRNKAANGGRFRHAQERRKRSASSAYSGLRLWEDFHGNLTYGRIFAVTLGGLGGNDNGWLIRPPLLVGASLLAKGMYGGKLAGFASKYRSYRIIPLGYTSPFKTVAKLAKHTSEL